MRTKIVIAIYSSFTENKTAMKLHTPVKRQDRREESKKEGGKKDRREERKIGGGKERKVGGKKGGWKESRKERRN